MNVISNPSIVCLLCTTVLTLVSTTAFPQSPKSDLAKSLETLVAKQAADWNSGDIDGYMKAYWNSEDLTFSSGGKTERG